MRELIKILVFIIFTVFLGLILAPPLYWLGHAVGDSGLWPFLSEFEFHRYFTRAILIAAVVLLSPLLRALHIRRGHITGQGKPWLRSYLVEAAWRTIAEDNAMQDTYNRLRQNTGSMKKAIVGVARKLCLRLHHLVTQQQNYAFGVVA